MSPNFFELVILEPRDGQSLEDENLKSELQYVLNELRSYHGGLGFEFRKSTSLNHQSRLLFIASWESIEDHDNLDILGVTPKLLKILLSNLTLISAYFFYQNASKVDFQATVWVVDAYHISSGKKGGFQKLVDESIGLVGSWYVTKDMPPLPTQMPTDPLEIRILKEGRERAELRLSQPTPEIWIGISKPEAAAEIATFKEEVCDCVSKVEVGSFAKFLASHGGVGIKE